MNQYVGWSPTAQTHDDFYIDESTRKWFRAYVAAVLTRTNTFSGKLYKDDPTIMAWELANEPRASRSTSNSLRLWIAEMSGHIKSLDPNHLVATGSEGLEFFVENHQVSTIDVCTVHLWPDTWHWDQERSLTWLRDRIREAHEIVRKPLILEEFGMHRDTTSPVPQPPEPTGGTGHTVTRDQFYQALLNVVYESKAAGALFWILYHDIYPDYDGFGVYYPADHSTVDIFRAAVARADALSSNGG
jgi:mannan endo-1,4-beta-mannosidase